MKRDAIEIARNALWLMEGALRYRGRDVDAGGQFHEMRSAVTGRSDQWCVAFFVPPDFADMDRGRFERLFLGEAVKRLAKRLPANETNFRSATMEAPRGVDAAVESLGGVAIRAVVVEQRVEGCLVPDGWAETRPAYDIDKDQTDICKMAWCIRLDVRRGEPEQDGAPS